MDKEFVFPPRLEASTVMRWHTETPHGELQRVNLHLADFQRSSPLVEAQLLGVLQHFRSGGASICVHLGRHLNDARSTHSRSWTAHWVEIFQRSTLGAILSEVATSIVDPEGVDQLTEIRAGQKESLLRSGGAIRRGDEHASIHCDTFGSRFNERIWGRRVDENVFRAQVVDLVARNIGLSHMPTAIPMRIGEFAYEAIENTTQHATRDSDGLPIAGLRLLVSRRFEASALASDTFEPLQALPRRPRNIPSATYEKYLEISVVDSGPGIAATMSGTSRIYMGSSDDERTILQAAVKRGGSSKSSSSGGIGLGLSKIARDAFFLDGIVLLRTGRWYGICRPSIPDQDSVEDWQWIAKPHTVGTAVSIVFPTRSSYRQPRPSTQLGLDIPTSNLEPMPLRL